VSNTASGDNDDLEALFDSIVMANAAAEAPAPEVKAAASAEAASTPAPGGDGLNEPYYTQIGHLTRKLHDTLHELGYDKNLEKAVDSMIPDARDRLAYIAAMTQQAAERVLNATDAAKPLQDQLERTSAALSTRWDSLFRNELSVDDFKQLVTDTRGFLQEVPRMTSATSDQLLEIMMAQDFQDLTGQVIKKVIEMAQQMENELLGLLLASTSAEKRSHIDSGLLNGPVINAEGRADIVSSQEQVDDLLESLGF
jgi:chemotaxis protein CheZ